MHGGEYGMGHMMLMLQVQLEGTKFGGGLTGP